VSDLYISVPAWTPPYIELAVKYTIPSVIASLKLREKQSNVTWLIHTDNKKAYEEVLRGYAVKYGTVFNTPTRDSHWVAFKQAHREAMAFTPHGSICVLLNSDIVVSKETISVVDKVFEDQSKKVIASVGIRTLIDGNVPPIGVSAKELNKYIWEHQHPITQECVWQTGRSHHPTILFFENGKDVSMHCFHMTPMFMRKDRNITFRGTIDDDVMQNYKDDEIYYIKDMECSFAELSPAWKTHPFGKPLSVQTVLSFDARGDGSRKFRPAHIRNFKQRVTVLGNPKQNDPNADEIIKALPARQLV
jgi:hypothetical protein